MSVTPTSFKHLGWLTAAMFLVALVPLVATLGDPGITWDEPVYRESQRLQAEWFARLARAGSWNDWRSLVSREATHDLWMSARYGLNFHPPLAGMLANLTHGVFGSWMHDLNSRRLASALELAGAVALLFHFLARRYGRSVGAVAGLSLLLTPRVFGHGHLAGTDMPMLFFWAAAALAYWKGQTSGAWRVAFAVLLALGFLVKLSTVFVLFPLLAWEVVDRLRRRSFDDAPPKGDIARQTPRKGPLARTLLLLLLVLPLLAAAWEAHRLAEGMRRETQKRLSDDQARRYLAYIDLRKPGVESRLPGVILLVPAALFGSFLVARRLAKRRKQPPPWLCEGGHGFETTAVVLAVSPMVVLALNPGWWRDTLIRIGHYSALFLDRKAALPDIEIYYGGAKYVYSLPWHNGWVLVAITVPLGILMLALVGVLRALYAVRRDVFPIFFVLNAAALPVLRMFPTPAHDGVRLMLPTFFFLAGLAGIGFGWLTERFLIQETEASKRNFKLLLPLAFIVAALGPAAFDLTRIHPYELSYYNRAVGGLSGAARRGFETTYWYDAVTSKTVAQINDALPEGARIVLSAHVDVFDEWQQRGAPRLREDLQLRDATSGPRFAFLLTHSSKSNPTTRLLFAQRPAFDPVKHAGVRLLSIYDSAAVARAQALDLLTAAKSERVVEGRSRLDPPQLSETVLEIARSHPEAIVEGARWLTDGRAFTQPLPDDSDVKLFLSEVFVNHPSGAAEVRRFLSEVVEEHPNALREAARTLVERPEAVAQIIRAEGYLPRAAVGGYLDTDTVP